jgi:hypothetical protein
MSFLEFDKKMYVMCSLISKYFEADVFCYEKENKIGYKLLNKNEMVLDYDPDMPWKVIKKSIEANMNENSECNICYENFEIKGVRTCCLCCNSWCSNCDVKLVSCPFCRETF